jgi:GH24 family phage-related lysozyme (muramidase)
MSDFIDLVLGDLSLWEGVIRHLYLDTKGFVTIAIGHLVADPGAAAALPLSEPKSGIEASDAEKRAAWAAVKRQEKGRLEAWYASITPWRLTQDQCFALARARLEREFLPALRKALPGFDDLPLPARRAIVDVSWNYGMGGLLRTTTFFPQLVAHDWRGAAATCARLDSRPLRNEWRAARFREATAG